MLSEVVDKIEQRGMQQGIQQKAHEDARKMLEERFEIEVISRITGLAEQGIKEL